MRRRGVDTGVRYYTVFAPGLVSVPGANLE
jgi:hypothetical protein